MSYDKEIYLDEEGIELILNCLRERERRIEIAVLNNGHSTKTDILRCRLAELIGGIECQK